MQKRIISKMGLVAAAAALLVGSTMGSTAQAATNARYIGYGYANTKDGVRCVQHSLNYIFSHMNIYHRQIAEDGLFGPETEEAIRYFQTHDTFDETVPDGVVGPKTGDGLQVWGDPNWNGGWSRGYCYWHLPTTW
ncbi:peptidoglycan-binding domain-containing protein [Streptomyces sp. TX20-6-3]|uniref:peptidoglycan-binding domain-containing protein n=1 Tax=Streptomyces sp. TX20-6-3 TaxID=3028705 RepID=UPI0029B96BEB|nr:peptidoglycan-binding domain-containing protein [Streptomyces sp. TX20-6-3]MDX2560756.1 peptidoglycan-binding domain-containing protein [Streptomyces sp. TX20-6-3]